MYTFPSNKFNPAVRTAIISGTGRSGKTTLGNILATGKNVEYADEPWMLHITSVMASLGLVDKEISKGLFRAHLSELANDLVLLRAANFRRDDLSSIWTKKSQKEITQRLEMSTARASVADFIAKNNSLFVFTFSADPGFNLPILADYVSGPLVYVVRQGIEVAHTIEGKRWFSKEQLQAPFHAQLYRPYMYEGSQWHLPCWLVEGAEAEFLWLNEFERGLYYWCTLVEKSIETLTMLGSQKYLLIKYEDMVRDPNIVLHVMSYLGTEPGSMTPQALETLKERAKEEGGVPAISETLRSRARALYDHFGYEWK